MIEIQYNLFVSLPLIEVTAYNLKSVSSLTGVSFIKVNQT